MPIIQGTFTGIVTYTENEIAHIIDAREGSEFALSADFIIRQQIRRMTIAIVPKIQAHHQIESGVLYYITAKI